MQKIIYQLIGVIISSTFFIVQIYANSTLDDIAYQQALDRMYPLSPAQVKQIKSRDKQQQKASSDELKKPISRDIPIEILPSKMGEPTLIRLTTGGITSLQFKGMEGNVWPIEQYNIANSNDIDVIASKNNRLLMLKAKTDYLDSTLVVLLKNIDTPITLRIVNWQSQWDYMVFLRVQAYQDPKDAAAKAAPKIAPDYLMQLLSGVPPSNAKLLKVKGDNDTKAWQFGSKVLLLTESTLLSPQYQSKLEDNTHGTTTHAYELPGYTPIIYISQHGQQVKLELSPN